MVEERMLMFARTNAALSAIVIASGPSTPVFTAVSVSLKDVSSTSFARRAVVMTTVPSLDTPVAIWNDRGAATSGGCLGKSAFPSRGRGASRPHQARLGNSGLIPHAAQGVSAFQRDRGLPARANSAAISAVASYSGA